MSDKLVSAKELMYNAQRCSYWDWGIKEQERFLDGVQSAIDSSLKVENNVDIRCKNCKWKQRVDDVIIWCNVWKKYLSECFFCGFGDDGKDDDR